MPTPFRQRINEKSFFTQRKKGSISAAFDLLIQN